MTDPKPIDIAALFAGMSASLEASVAAGDARRIETEKAYAEQAVAPSDFGTKRGPVHAASIQAWVRLAEMAGVPHIPATIVASVPTEDAWAALDGHPVSEAGAAAFATADAYAGAGGFWRTDLCAGSDVKHSMAAGGSMPDLLPVMFDDERLMDMHFGMPTIDVIGRPRLTPVRVNGYPVEFRVFHGGAAQDGAASFYYPQAGRFEVTPDLDQAMDDAIAMAAKLHALRAELGLVPWLPSQGEPDESIGSTIDFMLTEEQGLVMVDAGPGFGRGAHPCCFIDVPVEGCRWHLADGVEAR